MVTRRMQRAPTPLRGTNNLPAGFSDFATLEAPRRLIIASSGQDKSGKTHWAIATAPEPVYHIITDPNGYYIAQKIKRELGREIYVHKLDYSRSLGKPDAAKLWNQFEAAYDEALKQPKGTLVVDTATEAYELKRLEHFGKLTQVMPHNYMEVNTYFKDKLRQAYESQLTVVFIHKMKKEYKGDGNWTGDYERAGWGDMPFEVQVNVRHYYDGQNPQSPFRVYFYNNNQNMLDFAERDFSVEEPDQMSLEQLLSTTFDN